MRTEPGSKYPQNYYLIELNMFIQFVVLWENFDRLGNIITRQTL